MKKSTISLTLCALLLMLVMYNCKNKEAGPATLDQSLLDKLKSIKMADVTLETPKAVTSTEGSVDLSKKSLDLNAEITTLGATGVATDGLKAASDEISHVLTSAETAILANLKPEVIAAYAKGGTVPANVKTILDKAAKSNELAARQPIVVAPTVSGVVVSGRIGAGEPAPAIEKLSSTLISDACIALAEAAFQVTKGQLDANKTTQLAAAETSYSTAVDAATTAQGTCNNTANTKYETLLSKSETQYNTMNALLDSREAALGASYAMLKIQVFLQYYTYAAAVLAAQTTALTACQNIYNAKVTNATAAKNANIANINAAYQTSINNAIIARDALAQQCHNQGGGI